MNTVEKIKDTIARLDELNNDISNVLDSSYLINTKADISTIKQKIELAKSNAIESVSKLIKVKNQLESRLEQIKEVSLLHSELVMKVDDFMMQQRKYLPKFEYISKTSVLDRTSPFNRKTNLSKCHKELTTFILSISIADRIELINDTMKLTGRKKVYLKNGKIASPSCQVLNEILNATFHKKGFYLIKKAIDYACHQGELSPAELLTIIIQFYNRRTTTLSVINHQYE